MKLWIKIAVLNVIVVVGLGILIGLAVRSIVINSLRAELSKQGESLARNLSVSIADAVLLDDVYRTQEAIDDFLKAEHAVEYVFVIDKNGDLLSHTFRNGYPPDILKWNTLHDKLSSVQLLDTEQGFIRDVGVKIFGGMNPEVHVGIKEEKITQTLKRIRFLIVTLTGIAVLIGSVLSFSLSRVITKPLYALVGFTHTLSKGEFGTRVDIKSRDEVGELAATFNNLSHELEAYRNKMEDSYKQMLRTEKLTALGGLSAGLAHEIRNPLTSIMVLFRAFKDNPGLTREDMRVVLSAAEQMDEILARFLRFVRGDEFNPSEVYINPVIKEVLNLTQHQAKNQSVKVEMDLRKLPPVKADRPLIEQAIMNLVLNGMEAMPGGGTLTVSSREENGYLVVSVKDTGPGIPEDIQGKIFDPFFTTKGDGTGLGLSIAFNIVNLHNGDIRFESDGGGTLFTMKIPVHA